MKVLSNLFGTDKKISANSVAYKKDGKGVTLDNELGKFEYSRYQMYRNEQNLQTFTFDIPKINGGFSTYLVWGGWESHFYMLLLLILTI